MDSTNRFSNRVEMYVQYRPSYPTEAVNHIAAKAGLKENAVIADVGSGTGIFTRILLDRGYRVFAVEPNKEMREAAEKALSKYKSFVSINGTAEAATLPGNSVDCIVSAQAFHWFDIEPTRLEFSRMLKPGGIAALVWNRRLSEADAFATEYEQLLKQSAVDYTIVDHRLLGHEQFAAFFRDGQYERNEFANEQKFDLAGLIGRALSSSYTPPPGTEHHEAFLAKLEAIFHKHQQNGQVTFHYKTEVYSGKV
ncbi:class I SAM-dependent methyltransferase [Paenibacillus solisilvae]|uniref:Class I SAM-dependent methyltransferase n=1 Tax=Paenibacillus solisilvae TaxID=2486751 RepID=A0ABW0W6B5_9BACL